MPAYFDMVGMYVFPVPVEPAKLVGVSMQFLGRPHVVEISWVSKVKYRYTTGCLEICIRTEWYWYSSLGLADAVNGAYIWDTPLFAVLDHKALQYATCGIQQVVFLTSGFAVDKNGCQV
jgi:hypothetical protein